MRNVLGELGSYVDNVTWPWAIAVALIAVALPILYAVSGKRIRWLGPKSILTGYVLIAFVSLLALFGLGVALREFAPETFEVWRRAGQGGPEITLLVRLVIALPLAVGISSVGYSALEGWKGIGLALFGLVAACALRFITIWAVLWVACGAWSSCI
ncbi:MAG: hypothetical protein U1E87_01325 [Alphaproteobacteria bacterium]